ncbi:MAG: N-carbamoylsarcosine amidase, partial [Alphaproteobacteria bacterium]|nr:N-carbamoylsarcosine amidase [Alphaproteobacteria bacterium]
MAVDKVDKVDKDVRAALDVIFATDSDLYQKRGWNRRSGFGERPAILNIDLANAWTRPGYRFSCDNMDDQIIPGVQRPNEAARAKR